MSEQYFFLARSVKDAVEAGCFYTFEELVDATNTETADFLVANNYAISANYLPEHGRRPPKKEVAVDAKPEKLVRGRAKKDGAYLTRQMKAD